MSYHSGSYQPETHYQSSLPQNTQLYHGPQDTYSYGKRYSRGIHSVPYTNPRLHMTPQPQYPMVQQAPVYHPSAPQPVIFSSQSYPLEGQLQPQYTSRYVENRLGFNVTDQPQRNVYLPPPLSLPNHGPQSQLQFAPRQSTSYVSTGRYEPAPKSRRNSDPTFYPGLGLGPNNVAVPLASNSKQFKPRPDTNVLDGLPPLERTQGRFAHTNPNPKWEPKKARTVKPRLHPQFSLSAQRRSSVKGSNRDWSTLQPGVVHILIPMTSFLSSSPLTEYFQDAASHGDPVIYLPRSSEFSGKDKDPRACISFSVDGMPGPYLLDLAEARVTIDGEEDKIFEQFGWRTTKLQIDWPGLSIPPEGFKALDKDNHSLRRGQLAAIIATRIAKLIINTQRGYALPMGQTQKLKGSAKYWDIMKIDYHHLRLISVNHYDKVWVPVLALDVSAYHM